MQMQQTLMNSMMLMMMNSTGSNMPGRMNVMPSANSMMPQLNGMPQLNAVCQAPMNNAAFGHEDGGALKAPMGSAINQQEVDDTGGDDGDRSVGLTHVEQCHERNQMRLEAEERRRQSAPWIYLWKMI
jgi:hypothetical protein